MNISQDYLYHLSETKSCSICYNAGETFISIPSCNHFFCKKCFSAYLKFKITEGQVVFIPCPNPRCSSEVTSDMITRILSGEIVDKYQNFLSRKLKEKDPNLRWCPTLNCSGYDTKVNSNKLKCNSCSFQFCFLCADPWHEGTSCRIYEQLASTSLNMKRCPNCQVFIEKSRGCPEMTCSTCRFKFCWICEQNMETHNMIRCMMNSKRDPFYVYTGLFFIFFPVGVLFLLPFTIYLYLDILDETGQKIRFLNKKYSLMIIYVVSTIVSPACVILLTPIICLALGITFTNIIVKMSFKKNKILGWTALGCYFFIFAFLESLILLAAGLISSILPLVGVFMLIFKLVIMLKKPIA